MISNVWSLLTVDGEHRVRVESWRLAVVTTIAGSGAFGLAEGTGSQVMFRFPVDVTLDASGNLFVSDHFNHRIRKVTPVGGALLIDVCQWECTVRAQIRLIGISVTYLRSSFSCVLAHDLRKVVN